MNLYEEIRDNLKENEKGFDISVFNKEMDGGDLGAIEYIGETLINNLKEDPNKMTRVDYLKSLYRSVMALNTCVVTTEQCGDATERSDTFDRYAEVRDLLFEELGITYNSNTGKWELHKEEEI